MMLNKILTTPNAMMSKVSGYTNERISGVTCLCFFIDYHHEKILPNWCATHPLYFANNRLCIVARFVVAPIFTKTLLSDSS